MTIYAIESMKNFLEPPRSVFVRMYRMSSSRFFTPLRSTMRVLPLSCIAAVPWADDFCTEICRESVWAVWYLRDLTS